MNIKSKEKIRYFEIIGKQTHEYMVRIKATNEEQAIALASEHTPRDDLFWENIPESYNFEVVDITEIEDDE